MNTTKSPGAGLQDVVVSDSSICFIDGAKGILRYRGYEVNDLAENSHFEEVCYLLLKGVLPTADQLKAFSAELRANRVVPEPLLTLLERIPAQTNPMAWLRTAVSALAAFDPDAENFSDEARLRKTIRMTAQLSTLAAAIERIRKKQPLIKPDPSLDHAANFLYMLTGKKPDDLSRRAIDLTLILQADHDLNASTFAGRVTISTLSDLHSGVTSAIGALKGPLHGGANERVMAMLKSIDTVENVEPALKKMLEEKKKIMGFGHRVYSTLDPRAAILKRMSRDLSAKIGPTKWYEMSVKIEDLMVKEKNIRANVDFYSASVFHYVGIPTDLFTLLFAMSRVVGWCTHFLEQFANNRLIRPITNYTGPKDLKYVPVDQRKPA